LKKDGTVIWTNLTVSLVRTAEGAPDYFTTVVEDISRRKAAEERFRHLVEYGADLIVVVDREGLIRFVSRNVAHVLGFTAEEMTGRAVFDFNHPDDVAPAAALFGEIVATPRERRLTTIRAHHKNDGWRVLDVSVVNLLDDPSVAGLVINAHDVTERNRLGTEVEQLRRVESLGRVAASVAHEVNNVLMSISMAAGRARKLGADEEFHAMLKRALLRGKSITADILRFAQPAAVTRERVPLGDWLVDAVAELEPLAGPQHPLRLSLDEHLGEVRVDRTQLMQVLTNLVVNARDAMAAGGEIVIAGRHSEERHGEVLVTVTDRGTGISDELQERIFEPLFTTKGSGTGLGLPIVQQIVLRHGGRIRVESEKGRGTTFEVALPASS
jgi:PAS domain S-box-containing protein